MGEQDAPIVGATVVLAEIGQEAGTQTTDDVGQAFWYDLPGEMVNLSISAPGYFPLQTTDSIERGSNQLTVALERDPYGLLASEACGPGERLLYVEDFQDGEAQGWAEIEFRTKGWDVGPYPDSPGNLVALRPGERGVSVARLHDYPLHGAVWRVRFSFHGRLPIAFTRQAGGGYEVDGEKVEYSFYELNNTPLKGLYVFREQAPVYPTLLALLDLQRTLKSDVWHAVEIGTYEGLLEIWIDGARFLTYKDPKPLLGSGLKLSVDETTDADSVAYFDDISICELTAPFVPMPTPES